MYNLHTNSFKKFMSDSITHLECKVSPLVNIRLKSFKSAKAYLTFSKKDKL